MWPALCRRSRLDVGVREDHRLELRLDDVGHEPGTYASQHTMKRRKGQSQTDRQAVVVACGCVVRSGVDWLHGGASRCSKDRLGKEGQLACESSGFPRRAVQGLAYFVR